MHFAARPAAQAKVYSAWEKAAEGYVDNIQDGGGLENDSSASPDAPAAAPAVTVGMSVGHKLAARIVVNLSNKVRFCVLVDRRPFLFCFLGWGGGVGLVELIIC